MLSLSVAQNETESTTMLSLGVAQNENEDTTMLSLSVAQNENEDTNNAFPKCGVNICTMMNSLVHGRNLRRCFPEFMVVILLDDAF